MVLTKFGWTKYGMDQIWFRPNMGRTKNGSDQICWNKFGPTKNGRPKVSRPNLSRHHYFWFLFGCINHSINDWMWPQKDYKNGWFWVSLRVVVLLKYEVWVWAVLTLCQYGMHTDTVSVSVYTTSRHCNFRWNILIDILFRWNHCILYCTLS